MGRLGIALGQGDLWAALGRGPGQTSVYPSASSLSERGRDRQGRRRGRERCHPKVPALPFPALSRGVLPSPDFRTRSGEGARNRKAAGSTGRRRDMERERRRGRQRSGKRGRKREVGRGRKRNIWKGVVPPESAGLAISAPFARFSSFAELSAMTEKTHKKQKRSRRKGGKRDADGRQRRWEGEEDGRRGSDSQGRRGREAG